MKRIIFCFAILICTSATHSSEFDVDQADTLDFESFHKDKDSAIKLWDDDKNKTQKLYKDDPKAGKKESAEPAATTDQSKSLANVPENVTGKKFEIRERYSLERSTTTPYSAFFVIEALHKDMAITCPEGWEKIREWSIPVEQDFYLYYEFKCL